MLACLPALAVAVGCSDPPGTASAKEATGKRDPKARASANPQATVEPDVEAKRAAKARRQREGERPDEVEEAREAGGEPHASSAPPVADGVDPRFLPVPGDPPYVDGFNPEEETCPSGNWCGTIASAAFEAYAASMRNSGTGGVGPTSSMACTTSRARASSEAYQPTVVSLSCVPV